MAKTVYLGMIGDIMHPGYINICLLYTSPVEEANLCMIRDLAERFQVKSGLSDHTLGSVSPIVAVTQGASMIEKHFILNRSIGGPDCSFSMEEKDFAQMVKDVRMAELSLGKTTYELTEKMRGSRSASRSLYVACLLYTSSSLIRSTISVVWIF